MIQVSGPVIWNRIPDDIKEARSIFTFKKNLKVHIFDQYRGDPGNSSLGNNNNNNVTRSSTYTNRSHSNNQRWRRNAT